MIYILSTRITKSLIKTYDNMHKNSDVVVVLDAVPKCTNESHLIIEYVNHETLKKNGFTHVGRASKFTTCAYAYAIYLASKSNDEYSWFVEDDVVFSSCNTIAEIDQNVKADLVCRNHFHITQSLDWFYWVEATHESPFEKKNLHRSLQCVSRCSKRLLEEVTKLATSQKRLFFVEYLFNSICAENNFLVVNALCMKNIYYKVRRPVILHKHAIHHPIKDENERLNFLQNQTSYTGDVKVAYMKHDYMDISHDEIMSKLFVNMLRRFSSI